MPYSREGSMAELKGSETYVAAARLGMHVCAGHSFSADSVMSFRHRESIVATISGGSSRSSATASRAAWACGATEAAAGRGQLRFFIPNEPGFPPGCWLELPLQEREHAVQEELALGRMRSNWYS
jgi:hypothetical protein